MKAENRVWGFTAFLIAVAVFMLCAPAWADKRTGDVSARSSSESVSESVSKSISEATLTNENVLTGGANTANNSATIEGSRSYGYGMGDVDINECYRSWSVPLIQGTQVNPLCLAQQLMIEGNYKAAATLRCQPKGVYKAFGGRDECVQALSLPPPQPPIAVPDSRDKDDEDYHKAHEAELEALKAALSDAQEKARNATLEARYAVREAQKPAQTVIQREEFIDDNKRAKLTALKGAK